MRKSYFSTFDHERYGCESGGCDVTELYTRDH